MRFVCILMFFSTLLLADTVSPNMGMTLPTPGVTAGPLYATEIVNAFNTVDAHDHTPGKGVQVPSNGININNDLQFGGFRGASLKAITFALQNGLNTQPDSMYMASSGSGSSVVGVPIFNDNNGTQYLPVLLQTPVTQAVGDLFYASSGGTYSRLPIGSSGTFLKSAGGIPAWQSNATSLAVSTKTGNYTLTSSDGVIIADNSAVNASFTLTLPAAGSNSGQLYRIIATGSSLANVVTIARTGGDSIDQGTSYSLNSQNEEIELVSDGSSAWRILNHRYFPGWTAYTPTFTGMGAVSAISAWWRRVGQEIEVRAYWNNGTVSASVPATITLPAGVNIDTTVTPANGRGLFGFWNTIVNGATTPLSTQAVSYFTAEGTNQLTLCANSNGAQYRDEAANQVVVSSASVAVNFKAPISGWNP